VANTVRQYYRTVDFEKSPYEHPLTEPGTFAGQANAQAAKLNISKKPDLPLDVPVFDEGGLQAITRMRKERNYTDMYHVRGQTKVYRVRIGGLLEVDFHGKMKVDDSLGKLRVIRVRHVFSEKGEYFNEFDAVPEKFNRIPFPDLDIPVVHAIPAIVTGNEDPEGLGKVQVRFDFEDKYNDYWMPVMMPEAGGNSDVGKKKNRGMILIPEVKDLVIVSFFDGNPEFPFVMGSMFHGKNASQKHQGGGSGNHIRSLSDKANNFIQLNSKAGVKMQDQGGNYIHEDGTGNITVQSSKKIELVCNDGKGGEGSKLTMDKDGNISINGVVIRVNASKNILIVSKEKMLLWGKKIVNMISEKLNIAASKETHVTGGGGKIVEKSGKVFIN
jgi:uncharacterized protein involved in type VI secretion and phage assembly